MIIGAVVTRLILLFGIVSVASADADQDQYDFLTELYQLTSGEMWTNNTNWLVRNDNVSLCDWHGITCSGKWVQEIDLSGNGLGGPLPNGWERVPYLDDLDLSSNKLLGTIPSSITNLTINNFLLSHNSLTGTIPESIGNLKARLLYLDDNNFTGTLPSGIANSALVGLTLDLNKLRGPVPASLGDVGSHLMVISAAFNDFTGTLPSGVCKANACNFQYNMHLGCPSQSCKCAIPSCNCGNVCYDNSDCTGGSCPTCSKTAWGYKTCGGVMATEQV